MGELELLFERADQPAYPLPDPLKRRYGGALGFSEPVLYGNFVASLDGVVAIDAVPHVGAILSGGSSADRFIMGLLRACADAVLIGAGTLRASPDSSWTPEDAYPDAAAAYAELRRRLGRAPHPRLVVVEGGGGLDLAHPGLSRGGLILTTEVGRRRLPRQLPDSIEVQVLGSDRIDLARLRPALEAGGHRVVLSEAGPTLTGQLLEQSLLDELFLTLSSLIAGEPAGAWRPGFAAGVTLLPGTRRAARVLSVRHHDEQIFLRYRLPSV
ncbi:MAG: dihydrofolate reductase family protein [Candidatus Dormibacteria bacterium]